MARPNRSRAWVPAGHRRSRGFSLVELIVVIVITGILASVVGMFIAGPIQGFFDQARRAGLVDAAQLALTRLGRDVRAALPNSVRINGAGDTLEVLRTLDGDRYRAEAPGTAADRLEFSSPDTHFNTLAPLFPPTPLVSPYEVYGALAIYPLRQAGADPYVDGDDVMTPFGTLRISEVENPPASGRREYRVSLVDAAGNPGAHQFRYESPTRRVFLVQGPVTYRCEDGELRRYSDYAVAPIQPEPPAAPATVVARNVEACAFRYAAGTAQRNAVVSLALSLAQDGERVRLLRQVHVDNSP